MYHRFGKGEVISSSKPCDQRACMVLANGIQGAPCLASRIQLETQPAHLLSLQAGCRYSVLLAHFNIAPVKRQLDLTTAEQHLCCHYYIPTLNLLKRYFLDGLFERTFSSVNYKCFRVSRWFQRVLTTRSRQKCQAIQ